MLKQPKLTQGVIHVWTADVTKIMGLNELWQLLSDDEKERANKFLVATAKNSFICSRGILRKLISGYLDCAPCAIIFDYNEYGKLSLSGSALQFNLSHSQGMVVLGFTLNHAIGIDIEYRRANFNYTEIAERFFAPAEVRDLLALPKAVQREAFFATWARKEAFIKAVGKGVFYGLDNFAVEVSNKTSGRLQLQVSEPEDANIPWSLYALDAHPDYAAAVVTSAVTTNINKFNVELVGENNA